MAYPTFCRYPQTSGQAIKVNKSTTSPGDQRLEKIANFIKEKTFGGGKKSLILDKN